MDEDVGGREQRDHVVGEAADLHALVLAEGRLQALARRAVVAREDDDRVGAVVQGRLDRRGEVARAARAAGDDDERPARGQLELRARRVALGRVLQARVGEAVHGHDPRRGAGDRAHLGLGLRMRDEVQVDAGMRLEVQRGEVRDRADDGGREPAGRPQPAEQLCRERVRRDDDVGRMLQQERLQPCAEHPVEDARARASRRRDAGRQAVAGVEDAAAGRPLEQRGSAEDRLGGRSSGFDAVDDLRGRAAVAQPGREHLGRGVVAGGRRGGEDEGA